MANNIGRRSADKDNPIYKGGFVISSMNFNCGSMKSTETSQNDMAGQEMKRSTQATETQQRQTIQTLHNNQRYQNRVPLRESVVVGI